MPREIINEHGIVSATNATNSGPAILMVGEEFKNCRTNGTAIKRAYAKQTKHTTTEQRNIMETAFDWNQLILIEDL